ncbi:histidine kinase dimerization/phosphoacceptor domain -containing protein [Rhizobium jaguaris]|uniref:Signal transduction histidine kinase subgroup 2 dimerisation and phosphoacceptor domain-containing protein n=1 Tax=Rhizobium jaguaris TaxID=1312183 RepID=A0A387FYB9_9HYPH|nr:hypothetical protein CCGE525_25595 [Rhizobium jaguaris]
MVVDKTCISVGGKTVAADRVIGHREVGRWVANGLKLVSALPGFQARRSSKPGAPNALAAATDRIFAVAGVPRQLWREGSQHAADIASYSLNLAAALEQGGHAAIAITPSISSRVIGAMSRERNAVYGYALDAEGHGFAIVARSVAISLSDLAPCGWRDAASPSPGLSSHGNS